jgi:hypothetical protein
VFKIIFFLLLINLIFIPSQSFAEVAETAKEICQQVKNIEQPANELPNTLKNNELKDCVSQNFYYGIGQPIDYEKARLCAYEEFKKNDKLVFGGSTILMMIYANGFEVKKNILLAERFACLIEGAPAEFDGRIHHLEKLKTDLNDSSKFDLCDDITSGFMMGHCAKNLNLIESAKRVSTINALIATFNETEKNTFIKLQAASKDFTKARIDNEVDLSGTARSMFQINEEAIQEKDFIESLQKLEKGKAPKYTHAQFLEEEKKMTSLNNKIQNSKETWGTISKDGINETQKSWLKYRELWIDFSKIKYPKYTSESISTWFTKKRNHMLNSISR